MNDTNLFIVAFCRFLHLPRVERRLTYTHEYTCSQVHTHACMYAPEMRRGSRRAARDWAPGLIPTEAREEGIGVGGTARKARTCIIIKGNKARTDRKVETSQK